MTGRWDLKRSAITLLAAVLAAMGAYSANARIGHSGAEQPLFLLGAETLLGLGVALWPGGPWSTRRRVGTAVLAVVCLVLMFPGPIFSAISVAGCVCPGHAAAAVPLLGIGHQYWIIAGLFAFPVLLFVSGAIRGSQRAEMQPAPEASIEDSEARPSPRP